MEVFWNKKKYATKLKLCLLSMKKHCLHDLQFFFHTHQIKKMFLFHSYVSYIRTGFNE